MVVKKKQNCGFRGYWIPVIPRGPRSVRRRGLFKKTIEDSQICAFELLAAVAGKLLLESEGSASSNAAEGKDLSSIHSGGVKKKQLEGSKGLRSECLDQGSCIESGSLPGPNLESISIEFPPAVCDPVLESTSVISGSIFSEKLGHDLKSEIPENQTAAEKFPCKFVGGSSDWGQSSDGYLNNAITRQLEDEKNHNCNAHLTMTNTPCPKDETEICVKPHPMIKSDSSVQLTLFRDSIPNDSFPGRRKNVKVGNKDDENFVGCNRPYSKLRAFMSPRKGQWRIRKLLTSKYWKVAPKLKDSEFSNTDRGIKRISCNRKIFHTCKTIQREGPFKKRNFLNPSSAFAYDQEGSSESISNSPKKGMKGGKSGSVVNKASGVSSSAACHQASLPSKESHVKFSIKSFKVPELYIEVPETTTVGSLKRTVMEAVTAILRGGLHIGVRLQGNEVKDDNRTLLQTGISRNDYLDTLGFTLERSSATAFPPGSPKDPPVFQPCETPQRLTRLPVSPILDAEFSDALCDSPPVANVPNHVESNHGFVFSPTDEATNGTMPDSRALVSIPPISVEALAVVPLSLKTRRSELAQRRIRRPFSVSEVEALVEAVEKLGTGRWRDVKLRAFEGADHRTYVDLKDKWKTLVHTASITPQQRRGQPVPQDLLDRVLSAHSYWSQHQSKLHCKNHNQPIKILDNTHAVKN